MTNIESKITQNKVCIIYAGTYNFFYTHKETHKENLFNPLEELNIDYDVYISCGNKVYATQDFPQQCSHTKCIDSYIKKKQLLKKNPFYEKIIKDKNFVRIKMKNEYKIEEYTDDELLNFDENFNKKEKEIIMIQFLDNINKKAVQDSFYSIIDKNKIKYIDYKMEFKTEPNKYYYINKEVDVTNKGNSVHLVDTFFESTIYKRLEHLSDKIDKSKYSKFLVVMPDLKICSNTKSDLEKIFLLEKNWIMSVENCRLDTFHISNRFLPTFFNKKIYNTLLLNEEINKDKNEENNLCNIIEEAPWKYLHLEINHKILFEKLNIFVHKLSFAVKRQSLANIKI